jgi:hypothetical protein
MSKPKRWSEMTTAELREATKPFDDPAYHPPARPWTAEDRRVHKEARELAKSFKGGRPPIGLGAKRVNISMERRLLARLDAYARKHRLSRARVLAESVAMFLSAAA